VVAALGYGDPDGSTIADYGKRHHSNSRRLDPSHAAAAPDSALANYTPNIFDLAIAPWVSVKKLPQLSLIAR